MTPVLRTWIASIVTLSTEQKAHLSTPSYQDKKKKHERKAIMQESDSTLVEPSSVTVIGVATDVSQASSSPANSSKKRENSVDSNRSSKKRKLARLLARALERNHSKPQTDHRQ